jgi:NADH dehydrogenase/NADH:ubiquinone oxidoreductase subunit G
LCAFHYEYSGNFNFGVIGRGSGMEIGTYISNFIDDELSGML